MGQARRERRAFKRAYDKVVKATASKGIKTFKDANIQELINNLNKEYETQPSSK